ncbi:MAG: hypothetical protein JST31_15295 [Actinobacteria bacterium]|nr:hypothetical protein [Actinomycetota bacterium]
MARKTATGEEAAAIAAAVARFEAELAAVPAAPEQTYGAWQRVALLEGVSAKETLQDPQGGARWQS